VDTKNRVSSIVALLWQGKPSEAKRAITRERESLEAERQKLSASLEDINSQIGMLDTLMPTDTASNGLQNFIKKQASAQITERPKLLTAAQKRKRKNDVLAVVKRLALEKVEFTTDDIAKALEENGIDVGVPKNRINTAIGNIVVRSGQFEPVAKGVYKLKQPTLDCLR